MSQIDVFKNHSDSMEQNAKIKSIKKQLLKKCKYRRTILNVGNSLFLGLKEPRRDDIPLKSISHNEYFIPLTGALSLGSK